jgi:Mce-associated membrane protein
MPDDKLDLSATDLDSSVSSTTDGSQAMTNGANGHASVVQDPGNPVDVPGSAKSEKARPVKPKAQGGKSSAGKAANGAKSNGSKIPKDKRSPKSKASDEKASGIPDSPLRVDDRLPDFVEVGAGTAVAPSSEDLALSSSETVASQAASSPKRVAPISFSTTMPEDGESIDRNHRDARNFVRDNLASVILGLVSICLAAALVVTMLELGNRNSQLAAKNALESARTSALAAARTYSVEIASYNYQHLDQDFAAVAANSTPSWRRTYTQASSALKSILVKYNSSAQATLLSAGLVSATTIRAVAVVFLQQTVTNATTKRPSSSNSQLEITLDYSNGKWLIDDVTLF